MTEITITGHKWLPNANPRMCDKLEVFTCHNGKESWYMLDISGGKNKHAYSVQSATCIPFGTRAMPRNVTNRMPQAVTAWVNDFLLVKSRANARSASVVAEEDNTGYAPAAERFHAFDSATYDGAEDAGRQIVGQGATAEAALLDYDAELAEMHRCNIS